MFRRVVEKKRRNEGGIVVRFSAKTCGTVYRDPKVLWFFSRPLNHIHVEFL